MRGETLKLAYLFVSTVINVNISLKHNEMSNLKILSKF